MPCVRRKKESNMKAKSVKHTMRSNKGLWIGGGICVGICLILILTLVLIAPVSAWMRRADALEVLEMTGESRVVLTDPKQSGAELFSTAEIVLSETEAAEARALLYDALKNSEYDETRDASAGVWLICATVSFNSGEAEVRLYLDEDQIYLSHNGKLTSYEVEEPSEDAYENFYRSIKKRLGELG